MDRPVCQKCVNFLDTNTGIITCDYEWFVDVKYEQAILFVPEIFDCDHYEQVEE
jgi:hypothetical protein